MASSAEDPRSSHGSTTTVLVANTASSGRQGPSIQAAGVDTNRAHIRQPGSADTTVHDCYAQNQRKHEHSQQAKQKTRNTSGILSPFSSTARFLCSSVDAVEADSSSCKFPGEVSPANYLGLKNGIISGEAVWLVFTNSETQW
ncbi:unnamed protein product [Miscanthus lutarioriparius]|uniref:Uncharacterized protein n=1 Tax=Miscanthus lutarioriparius TaxID=422564 RepID=A0A811Q6K3_9POAL|nr:unnamed protein product [Miscanthus lutarioriparius]